MTRMTKFTVRELINELLEHDLDKKISIEYPTKNLNSSNYASYEQADFFEIIDCDYGIIIGVE